MAEVPAVLVIGAHVTGADVELLSQRLRMALQRHPGAPALCDVAAIAEPSLEAISVLARLQVLARALGRPFLLINSSRRLSDVVELAGLTSVLPQWTASPATTPFRGDMPSDEIPAMDVPSRDIGSPNKGNSASVSRNAVNSAICPSENSST
ncbi:MAG: Sulfate transporter [Jatrophihabitantaceae bacterium]|nr:Sulfate transporter [Jatrophihabitantaceae bacterium]